ncbi:LamG-like jellyroll fold domain-containing protein [Planctomycetota bacterium]
MFRRLIYLICSVLLLGLVLTSTANASFPGLIAHWRLDEGAGTIVGDASGFGNNGTLNGGQWTEGKLDGAVYLDGVDDYIEIPNVLTEIGTLAFWFKPDWDGTDPADYRLFDASLGGIYFFISKGANHADINPEEFGFYLEDATDADYQGIEFDPAGVINADTWHHVAVTWEFGGGPAILYLDGQEVSRANSLGPFPALDPNPRFGLETFTYIPSANGAKAVIDDIMYYDKVLTDAEIQVIMVGLGAFPYAWNPNPKDGTLLNDTWISLGWSPGDFTVSHDVYLGDNLEDVNNGTGDTFRGNQSDLFYVAGFPGYAYENGLVPGTTYYWRINEVNEAEPNSPWKGNIWSFSVPPKTAYDPVPADGAEFVLTEARLTWTAGFGTKLHYIVFGENYDQVSNAVMGVPYGTTNYNPGPLELAKTYYWRVDEFDGAGTYKGEVWSFTTEGAVTGPNPADSAVDVKPTVIFSWIAGAVAASHEVYFGTDADAVANATTASPEYKGAKALGEESYDPGMLTLNTAYFWRIDEVNGVNPDSPWAGNVWSFTTGDFFVIDDFEIYDSNDNQIWYSWHDGLGYGVAGMDPYFAGNGTGAAVGDETTASYTEETIVNGGSQSMPLTYDNNKQGFSKYSEVEYTLTDQRDWTAEGVTELSLWFRGNPASVGSFVEGPVGTYTITASGADIWVVNGVEADEFHFAYKTLTGTGSMVAKVESVDNTNVWAKAGVMIRETLNPDSAHAMMVVTPGSGVSFQRRPGTGQTSLNTDEAGITAPYWVKIERDMSGNFTGYSSPNGSTWTMVGTWENIPMVSNVYIGLAVTAHNASAACEAVFTNVTTTGSVGQQWANQDIGIASNDVEPLYVAVSNIAGTPAVVVYDDPAAATIDTWTQWVIPLQVFADQGIVLTNVDRITIGLGTQGNMTIPGGSGKMYIDNVRLNIPSTAP